MEVQENPDQGLRGFGGDVLQSHDDLLSAPLESIHSRANHRVITLVSKRLTRSQDKRLRASLRSQQLRLRVAQQSDRVHLQQHLVSQRQGIGDDPHSWARRQRLSCGDLGNVDHVTAVVHHDGAGLPEECIDCGLWSMAKSAAYASVISTTCTAWREHNDRLSASELPGDSGEFPRIADRVQGEQAYP